MFGRAVGIGEKAFGAAHALTQRFQSRYARLLLMTDRPGEALSVGERALAAHEAAYGPKDPWTKDSAAVTADALAALGRADEAAAVRARYGIARGAAT